MNFEASPELDALIAEKVFGWKWNIRNGVCYTDRFTENAQDCWFLFQPSTDIHDAWEVIEKIADTLPQGFTIRTPGFKDRWICEWKFDHMAVLDDGYQEAPTAPLAVCRAVLKVIQDGK